MNFNNRVTKKHLKKSKLAKYIKHGKHVKHVKKKVYKKKIWWN